MIAVFLLCIAAGLGVYFGLVRPFFVPLEKRIPTGRIYRATVSPKKTRA